MHRAGTFVRMAVGSPPCSELLPVLFPPGPPSSWRQAPAALNFTWGFRPAHCTPPALPLHSAQTHPCTLPSTRPNLTHPTLTHPPSRPAELEVDTELTLDENEIFYSDETASHPLYTGGRAP